MGQRKPTLRLKRLLFPLLLTVIFIQPPSSVRAEVILNYFRASSQEDGVLIEWETSSETNSSGFYILRSLRQDQDYTRINIYFLSDSEAGEGVFYSYLDDQVTAGTIYYYKLEAIDQDGTRELFGPVSVGYKLQSGTPTPTATNPYGLQTPIPTNTPTPTRGTTAQPNVTLTPPLTATIFVSPSQTLSPSATITGTISTILTETPTLEPLPTFELIFPAITSTRAATATLTPEILPTEKTPITPLALQPISSRHVFLLGILALLWLTLAGFIVLWFWKFFQDLPKGEEDNVE